MSSGLPLAWFFNNQWAVAQNVSGNENPKSLLGWRKIIPNTRGLQEAVGRPGAQIQSSPEHFLMHWVENAVSTATAGRIWANLSSERHLHPAHDGTSSSLVLLHALDRSLHVLSFKERHCNSKLQSVPP